MKISKKANAVEVMQEALKKRKVHDRSFRMDRSYFLAYPDGTEVVSVPGTNEPFILVKYKEELGKGSLESFSIYPSVRSSAKILQQMNVVLIYMPQLEGLRLFHK